MVVVPFILIGLAAILPFGHVPEIRMAVCVVALTAGAPFIPWVTSIGREISNILKVFRYFSQSSHYSSTIYSANCFKHPEYCGCDYSGDLAWPIIYLMLIMLISGFLIRARYLN